MAELLDGWKRTGLCTDYDENSIGEKVVLMGWTSVRRNLGSLIFIDLRDRSGIIQLVFDESTYKGDYEKVESIRSEYVLAVKGKVIKRGGAVNNALKTGKIEIEVEDLKILSEASTPPFEIDNDINVREELRLKYRYLDLRRPKMQQNIMLRSRIVNSVHSFLNDNGFLEIETPILQKSTPEGARDYLVPSRVHEGCFYALPQSPQLFKQILMVSGFDRYYQIARCFRDEDLRADRQPEFTQIDMEMSFVEAEDVMSVTERLIAHVFKEVLGKEIQLPLRRIKYSEAMARYGSDKPDTRFGYELCDISDVVKDSGFKVFSGAVASGGSVRAINAKGCASAYSRKEIDALGEFVKTYGAKGLAWMILKEDGTMTSPVAKFLSEDEISGIKAATGAEAGDVLFFVADSNKVVFTALGALRINIAQKMGKIEEGSFDLLWVTEFPQFEYSDEEGRYVAMHHPFTSPMDEDQDLIEKDPGAVRAKAYDIVLNGNELGGGSIRIHDPELQERMFRALGFSKEQAWERFGFLMEAFKYGTPPHGGLAIGLERFAMILGGCDSIRDVTAFPKAQNAMCYMTNAPSLVDDDQLKELHLNVVRDDK